MPGIRGPRYALTAAPAAVRACFGYPETPDFPPRREIAPGEPVAVVHSLAGKARFALMRWGFWPSWIKDPRELSLLATARAETAALRPAFRGAFRYRRCLIPATGYFLSAATNGPDARPLLLCPRAGGVMAIGGLWETWSGADGSEIDTACLLTIAAAEPAASLPRRLPLIVPPERFGDWLAPDAAPAALLRPPAPGLFFAAPIAPHGPPAAAAESRDG
jgi:putative SOS response-associated peptidase YedK